MRKRGQVTIFIILAIIIVVLGILIYLYYPQIMATIKPGSRNPNSFIQTCIEDEIEETVEILSLQGGSMNPEGYYLYEGNKLKYLCYTNQDYKLCGVQISFLKAHIESEIKNEIQEEVDICFQDLKESYEARNYEVILRPGNTTVEILPGKILTTFTHELTLIKKDSERFETFRVGIDTTLYDLIGITTSIIYWESTYGEAEPLMYMGLYHYLDIEKLKQIDDTKVYILTNINTGDKFQFASRSLPFPPGI